MTPEHVPLRLIVLRNDLRALDAKREALYQALLAPDAPPGPIAHLASAHGSVTAALCALEHALREAGGETKRP